MIRWWTLSLLLVGCGTPQPGIGALHSAVFVNGGFETGAANAPPPSWTVQTFLNPSITVQTPQTRTGLNLGAGGTALSVILRAAAGPETQTDPFVGATGSLRWPKFGNQCAITNQAGKNKNVNSVSQTMTIAAGDVDPSDGQVHVRFVVAPVLENPAHLVNQQPYYFVQLTNTTQSTILYSDFNLSGQPGIPWKKIVGGGTEYDYTDWQLVDIAPGAAKLAIGDVVLLEVMAAGCSLGAHMGQVYVDGVGSTIPGLNVVAQGPAQANAGTNITYTLTYKNGGAAPAAGVTVEFNTPPGTTFESLSAAGLTCTQPVVGAAGLVSCTVGALAAGGSGSFQITVKIDAAATGTVLAGNYDILATGYAPLIGPKVLTQIGCTQDVDCASGTWCNESGNACTPTLANGTGMPNDPPHTSPTLNSTCTVAAATLVCTSAVCDPADNKCGLANGDGICSAANGATVCRSAVCDPDNKCGYAVGDGPCSAANAATVCRSGACSTNAKCMPAAGCNVDADCSGGKWCNEAAHTCTAKLTNGTTLPNDPPHTSPTLNATCTTAAATLVCVSTVCDTADNRCGYLNATGPCTTGNAATICRSGVCDPDAKCGYADGDGPCTAGNAGTVCRSGACSSNGTCEPAGGCNVDADCTGGKWCNETLHTCAVKLGNGTILPVDAPHSAPTLNGMCTAPAATLVCTSGVCDGGDNRCGYLNGSGPCSVGNAAALCRSAVCDPDGKCGYAVGDGPCTAVNGGVVCRSGTCSTNGTCTTTNGCNVDADCAGGKWCNESSHICMPRLGNGMSMPSDGPHTGPTLDGKCTTAAAALVCASGVCDTTDDKCGYADGNGPCSQATGPVVCRSAACGANNVCLPVGGCGVDADCVTGTWCNQTAHQCAPQVGNGSSLPKDAPHTAPTLDGSCTPAAAVLVCASGVCDATDDQCGLADGTGPCTIDSAGMVCRSGQCGADGTCGIKQIAGCTVDADCTDPTLPRCDSASHVCGANPPGLRVAFAGGGFCAIAATRDGGDGQPLVLMMAFALCTLLLRARTRRQ